MDDSKIHNLKIGIIGTRGIPNNYGGFEKWAEDLAPGLVERGCEVYVYNSHNHPFKEKTWKGVKIIHKYDPEYLTGTAGQFIYDLNCILDSRKRDFDIILQLGYTSSSVWGRLLPKKKSVIITNMDGLEWQREKFSSYVKHFLKFAEKLAVKWSHSLIADSPVIEEYYKTNYKKPVSYIPYGTSLFDIPDEKYIDQLNLKTYQFNLLIARLEPENNIETIITGVINSESTTPLIVVGKYNTTHGKYLYDKYSGNKKIIFKGGIYDQEILNNLRYFSNIYFHGHSVGGTNPSLLEAMACNAFICANDNPYNRSVLNNTGFYFTSSNDITNYLNKNPQKVEHPDYMENNRSRIINNFELNKVIDEYLRGMLASAQLGQWFEITSVSGSVSGSK